MKVLQSLLIKKKSTLTKRGRWYFNSRINSVEKMKSMGTVKKPQATRKMIDHVGREGREEEEVRNEPRAGKKGKSIQVLR